MTAAGIKEGTSVPLVIHDTAGNENKKITIGQFIEYLSSHLNLNKAKLDIDGTEYSLYGILYQLLHVTPGGDDPIVYNVSAGDVGYINVETIGSSVLSVQNALDLILGILYGHNKDNTPVVFPTSAEESDITDVITTSQS